MYIIKKKTKRPNSWQKSLKISQPILCIIIKSQAQIVKDAKLKDKNLDYGVNKSNSANGINESNSVIGIKLLMAQSDPIKRRPLYIKGFVH
jgi:hypothetical protein